MARELCGQPLRNYEWPGGPAVLDGLTCGKRKGHKSKRHRSLTAMREARRRGATSQPATGSLDVAEAIRQGRQRAGMTQRRLAVVLGVTETAVQHWEYGKRTPGQEAWVQLELALGPLGVVRSPRPVEAGEQQGEAA